MQKIEVTEIENIKIGNAQNLEAATGCTVVICDEGAVCGIDVRGGAPGTIETDLLNPVNLVEKVHGVFLSGGSSFGLDCASGIKKFLEEKKIGFDVHVTNVPIVPGAVLFDLTIGSSSIRPDAVMGYEACLNASSEPVLRGNVGAGTGCTVGKFLGPKRAMKSGLGSYALQVGDLKVGAIVAVNSLGNIVDSQNNKSIAGLLNDERTEIVDSEEAMINFYEKKTNLFSGNTTIGIVVTNASLTKAEATKISSMTHNGYARSIRPSHTMFDGDTIFTMSVGAVSADVSVVGLLSANVMEKAVIEAGKNAEALLGLKSYSDIQ